MRLATSKSAVGRLLRLPLKAIPPERPLRILRGPLRGHRWIPGASVHGCWLGTFERYEQALVKQLVAPGDVVFDIGANVGLYTLLAAHLVGSTGRVVAFEPVARNIAYLKRHLELNAVTNVRVIEAAVSNETGIAHFQLGPTHSEGHLVASGSSHAASLEVPQVTIDDLVSREDVPPPRLLKIDVEGGEYDVLRGAAAVLRSTRPQILLSAHSATLGRQCVDFLTDLRYDVRPMMDCGVLEGEFHCVPRRVSIGAA